MHSHASFQRFPNIVMKLALTVKAVRPANRATRENQSLRSLFGAR